MPVFGDSNNIPPVLPEGDYVFRVTEFEIGISKGKKTAGAEKYQLELQIEPSGKPINENLVDHPSSAWKIDCFLKSAGVKLAKGQVFDFREDNARRDNVLWVNPIGLRGWCHLIQETLPARDQQEADDIKSGCKRAMVVNRVSIFYTDKEKLAPVVQAEEEGPF